VPKIAVAADSGSLSRPTKRRLERETLFSDNEIH
jgi:hypothetical protein